MPDTNGGRMLTALDAQLSGTLVRSPADRMRTPAILPPGRPEPSWRRAAPRKRTPHPATRWLGRGALIAGLGMIPWVFILACTLPSTARAAHWSAAWAGLDGLEAVGLMMTGVALIRRYRWLSLPAAVTSTLLVIDAWFDVTTSAPGSAVKVAIAMAVFLELPTAALCAMLAIRNARPARPPTASRPRWTGWPGSRTASRPDRPAGTWRRTPSRPGRGSTRPTRGWKDGGRRWQPAATRGTARKAAGDRVRASSTSRIWPRSPLTIPRRAADRLSQPGADRRRAPAGP
jgi:hypothetical protein